MSSSIKIYDVVIIGGGIHGVGVAQAAAAAGYSVFVIEDKVLAHGTSSKSSKLIHGGLRYLETAQFKLVFECLRERSKLLKLAPGLVRLEPFNIPIYKHTRRRPWHIFAGLSLYSILGLMKSSALFERLPEKDWDNLDGLDTNDLQAVFRYMDGATDDAALTRAVMNSAKSLGAELAMPAKFLSAQPIEGANEVKVSVGGTIHSYKARVLVNATGPWVNAVLDKVTSKPEKLACDLVAGTHIVIDEPAPKGVYYLEAPQDGRAVFVMPWKGSTLIGTTETKYDDDPALIKPIKEEIEYLCEVAGAYFPKHKSLKAEDVVESFAGLRVLPHAEGNAFSRPRETIFHVDKKRAPRVVTIYGGKLTAYRKTSEKLVSKYARLLPKRIRKAITSNLQLS